MKKLDSSSNSLVTRTLDGVDRAHARIAMRAHDARNVVLTTLEHGLDRAEQLIASARKGIKRADQVSADAVNRAQGVVGQAIERARIARTIPEHVAS